METPFKLRVSSDCTSHAMAPVETGNTGKTGEVGMQFVMFPGDCRTDRDRVRS